MAARQKFFEIIKPGVNIDFVGTRKVWIGISIFLLLVSLAMLALNAWVIPGRGQMLNWSVEFKGGSEIEAGFNKPITAAEISEILEGAGYRGVEATRTYAAPGVQSNDYIIRMGTVAALSPEELEKARTTLTRDKVAGAGLRELELSEGGDKAYVRLDAPVTIDALTEALTKAGITPTQVQSFGRTEDNTFEVTLVSLKDEVDAALEAKLGTDGVEIKKLSSVGAKAGAQLRNDGIKAMLGAMLLIVIYVAFRFDFRYGPATIVALLHDVLFTVGAFALTYREFSLTVLAGILTIIGFSVNDTIVIFDRIREDAAKQRDRRFDRVVNQAINETLSRTIWTSGTTFFVTLAMNIFGTGVIRDFAFALNVGIVVGSYSSIFIASPLVIWLNDKYLASQKQKGARGGRQGRQPVRNQDDRPPG